MQVQINIQQGYTSNKMLEPYIDSYVLLHGGTYKKSILPRPGGAISFNFEERIYNNSLCLKGAIIGFHHQAFSVGNNNPKAQSFTIKFKPYGLSKFLNKPVADYTDKIIDLSKLLPNKVLFQILEMLPDLQSKINAFEACFLERLFDSDAIEHQLFDFINHIGQSDFNTYPLSLRKNITLSKRQFERRFKNLTGTNVRNFQQVCRFAEAIKHMQHQYSSLSNISHKLNYFDQPHFSRNFKTMAGIAPVNYTSCNSDIMNNLPVTI